MAEETLVDEARRELICPLCIVTFKQPRSLSCLHSYCEDCLQGLVRATASKSLVVSCPECRADTQLKAGGVKDLPINFKLKRFVEIINAEECQKITRKESSHKMGYTHSDPMCPDHLGKLEYYCMPCKEMICTTCVMENHLNHDMKPAAKVLEQYVMELKKNVSDMDKMMRDGEVMLESLKEDLSKLDMALCSEISRVHSYFANIRKILDSKEKTFVTEMKTPFDQRGNKSQKHIDKLTEALEELERSKQILEHAVDRKSKDISLLLEEKQLHFQISKGKKLVEDEIFHSKNIYDTFACTPFKPQPDIQKHCLNLKYTAESSAISMPSSLGLSRKGREKLCFRHISLSQSSSNECTSVLSLKRSSSVVSLKLGIARSEVFTPVFVIEAKGLIGAYDEKTAYPNGICCSTKGTLLVTDAQHHFFRIITSTGKCLQTIGSEGKGDGQFYEPTGITLDHEGNILVLDGKGAGRIQKFSMEGEFLSKFKVRELTASPYMEEPIDLVVLTNDDVLVTDSGKSCVHVFNASGKYQGRFGNVTEFKQPSGIAANESRVVIADKGNHCLFILDLYGEFIMRVGKQGAQPEELNIPFGVAIHNDGDIVVSESGNHRISVFTSWGKFIHYFGVEGSEYGQFDTPRQLCFNHEGLLVVCDKGNQRLQLFSDVT